MTEQSNSQNGLQHWAIAASFLGLLIVAAAFLVLELEIDHAKDFFGTGIIFAAVFGAIGVVLGVICRKLAAGWVAIAVGAICVAILLTLLLWKSGPVDPQAREMLPLGKQDSSLQQGGIAPTDE